MQTEYRAILQDLVDASGLSLGKIAEACSARGEDAQVSKAYLSLILSGKADPPLRRGLNRALSEVLGFESNRLQTAAEAHHLAKAAPEIREAALRMAALLLDSFRVTVQALKTLDLFEVEEFDKLETDSMDSVPRLLDYVEWRLFEARLQVSPERRRESEAVALSVSDGTTEAHEAVVRPLVGLLDLLGVDDWQQLRNYLPPGVADITPGGDYYDRMKKALHRIESPYGDQWDLYVRTQRLTGAPHKVVSGAVHGLLLMLTAFRKDDTHPQ